MKLTGPQHWRGYKPRRCLSSLQVQRNLHMKKMTAIKLTCWKCGTSCASSCNKSCVFSGAYLAHIGNESLHIAIHLHFTGHNDQCAAISASSLFLAVTVAHQQPRYEWILFIIKVKVKVKVPCSSYIIEDRSWLWTLDSQSAGDVSHIPPKRLPLT